MRWRVVSRNLGGPQRYKVAALERVALKLRALPAAHVALEFVDGRALGTAHGVERNGLMGVTAQALDLQMAVAGVQGVTERG